MSVPTLDAAAAARSLRVTRATLYAYVLEAVHEIGGQRPNVDFSLASLRRSLALPHGSGLVLFAIARTVGWIAHALEQNMEKRLIRPRAEYVGVRPG